MNSISNSEKVQLIPFYDVFFRSFRTGRMADQATPVWFEELKANGYCVVKGVANATEVEQARGMFWDAFEGNTKGLSRSDISTWQSWNFSNEIGSTGILLEPALLHSKAAWFIRGLPSVKKCFSTIWNTADLIVSFDSLLVWKPWWENKMWTPHTEGLHMDQNPFHKPQFCCVQGMVPLYDVTPQTGGLAVVAKSHLENAKFKADYPQWGRILDFCILSKKDPMQAHPKVVLCEAGDLILWDSRTVHGGIVGTGGTSGSTPQLARLAQTVCMTPRAWATEKVRTQRKLLFEQGKATTHWPHEIRVTATPSGPFKAVDLSPEQMALV